MKPIDPQTEPATAEHLAQPVAGFAASPPPGRPGVGRAAAVIALTVLGVVSPGLIPFTVPFAVALLAIGLAYGATRAYSIVAGVVASACSAALVAAMDVGVEWVALAAVSAAAITALGVAQHRAVEPDPEPVGTPVEWPEPLWNTGFTFAYIAWCVVATVIVAGVITLAGPSEIRDASVRFVDTSFEGLLTECKPKGAFAEEEQLCDLVERSYSDERELVRDHSLPLLTGLAAILAFLGAVVSHSIVFTRMRSLAIRGTAVPVRPARVARELEVHWSFAYVGFAGICTLIAAFNVDGWDRPVPIAIGVGLSLIAGFALFTQGIGLLTWLFGRRKLPLWYKILLGVLAFFTLPFSLGLPAAAGMLDIWMQPRRPKEPKADVGR